MFEKINLDRIAHSMNMGCSYYFIEGPKNTTILLLEDSFKENVYYSLKKEDIDSIKLLLEIENVNYTIYPNNYLKYAKDLSKYDYKGEIWFFEDYYVGGCEIYIYDFKTNKIDRKHKYNREIIKAAEDFGYNININTKPSCWKKDYSNGLN